MISKGIISEKSGFRIIPDSGRIEKFKENTKKLIRFSRPSAKNYNPKGFSDHFPISVKLSLL